MLNPKLYWYEICHKIYISQLSMLFFHAFLMGLLEICNSWFLAHNWTSSGCLAKLRSCFILCLLFTSLIICALPPPLAPIPTRHLFSKLLPVTRFRVQVIKVWTKGSLIFLVSSKNTTIQIKNTKSVRWLCPPSHPPNWTNQPKLFSHRYFVQACFKKCEKLFALPKFGSLWGSPLASLKIGEIFQQSAKIWQLFETRAHAYSLLLVKTDLLLVQTKLALVRPGPNIINFLELINDLSVSNKGSHDWAVFG